MNGALSFFLVAVFAVGAGSPQVAPSLDDDEIRNILTDRVDRAKDALGVVVGIVDEGGPRVIGYGRPFKDSTQTVNGDTVFMIGSVTKTFTATLLADMLERGEVHLGDRISEYLPPGVKAPARNGREITLLDLATHTSGLPEDPDGLNVLKTQFLGRISFTSYVRSLYATDRMYAFLSNYKLPRDPGEKYEYSNYGFALLGHLLARRAGADYESLVRTRILDVLKMDDTYVKPTPGMEQRMAKGHYTLKHKEAPRIDVDWIAPQCCLYSTANDLLKYLAANMGLKETPLRVAMETAHRPQRDTDNNHWGMDFVGLGWEILKKYDPEIVWHDGSVMGYRSFVGMDKKNRRGVVVLWNSAESNLTDIGRHLLDQRYALWKERRAIAIDSKLLDVYAGEYRSVPTYGLTFTRQGQRFFSQGTGGQKREMFAESETAFFASDSNFRVVFARDTAGRLTATVYTSDGLDFTVPKIK
jgi:D-alanyl-D-alanine-carboxypeptidase/D-alanyl-D-alanine-endopeptidase